MGDQFANTDADADADADADNDNNSDSDSIGLRLSRDVRVGLWSYLLTLIPVVWLLLLMGGIICPFLLKSIPHDSRIT